MLGVESDGRGSVEPQAGPGTMTGLESPKEKKHSRRRRQNGLKKQAMRQEAAAGDHGGAW